MRRPINLKTAKLILKRRRLRLGDLICRSDIVLSLRNAARGYTPEIVKKDSKGRIVPGLN